MASDNLAASLAAVEEALDAAVEETVHPDPLAEFVAIEQRLREIDEESDRLKKRQAALQERLLDEWADRGQQSANVNGFTVYVAHDFYCNKRAGVPTDEVCRRLTAAGLGTMVGPNYSAASLKAWVKERADAGLVPDDLAAVLQWDKVPKLRARKA